MFLVITCERTRTPLVSSGSQIAGRVEALSTTMTSNSSGLSGSEPRIASVRSSSLGRLCVGMMKLASMIGRVFQTAWPIRARMATASPSPGAYASREACSRTIA